MLDNLIVALENTEVQSIGTAVCLGLIVAALLFPSRRF